MPWVLKHDQEFSKQENWNRRGQGTHKQSAWLLEKEVSRISETLGAILEGLEFKLQSNGYALSYKAVRAPLDLCYRLV